MAPVRVPVGPPRRRLAAGLCCTALALTACSGGDDRPITSGSSSAAGSAGAPSSAPASTSSPPTAGPSPEPTPEPSVGPRAGPVDRVVASAVVRDVRHLAGRIGPRMATGPAYLRAAAWVERRLDALGYATSRMPVRAPAGDTWGVDVPAGRSPNVLADSPGFDPRRPHVVVGAHLDTVPVAPGAEDNASGVAVMLELARLATDTELAVPVRFVAFGAEEPRGEGDLLHHFGSTTYVEQMGPAERDALQAMVSLDRVGVAGEPVPICTGPYAGPEVRDALADAARRAGITHRVCADNTTSDHWSFEKAGLPVARIGSVDYAGYHSAEDVPSVVSPRRLAASGTVAWDWLRRL